MRVAGIPSRARPPTVPDADAPAAAETGDASVAADAADGIRAGRAPRADCASRSTRTESDTPNSSAPTNPTAYATMSPDPSPSTAHPNPDEPLGGGGERSEAPMAIAPTECPNWSNSPTTRHRTPHRGTR